MYIELICKHHMLATRSARIVVNVIYDNMNWKHS